jgi:(R,R)-butanediol dehydrogenase / meso-butanediol dehydrogenase / diacetyl reductase
MRAVVVQESGELAVAEAPTPKLTGGDLLLRVGACGICGSDLHVAHGLPPGSILGHEFSGEVVEVGPEVDGWRTGDCVVALPFFACGECERCRGGLQIFCERNRGLGMGDLPGAYAEHVRVQAAHCLRIPDGIDLRTAALVEPLAVGLRGVRRSRLAAGDVTIVLGAGPIGIATLLWAKERGARTVVSDVSPGRREMAMRLGADAVVDPMREDPGDAARALGAAGPAVVFEATGFKGVLQSAIDVAPIQSEIIVVGVCTEVDQIIPVMAVVRELDVRFAYSYSATEFAESLDALANGRIDANAMITDVIGLDEVAETFRALRTPSTQCKVLIEAR